jgi:hypothetical protein
MALGSTQPLTEMSTRALPKVKGRPVRKADNFTAIFEPIFWKMWKTQRLTTLWAFTACYRDSCTLLILCSKIILRNIVSRFCGLCVTYKTGSGLDDWIY